LKPLSPPRSLFFPLANLQDFRAGKVICEEVTLLLKSLEIWKYGRPSLPEKIDLCLFLNFEAFFLPLG